MKKSKLPKPTGNKKEAQISSNTESLKNNSKLSIITANKTLIEAKKLDADKIKNGFVSMIKLKSVKLVSPGRINSNLADGWVLLRKLGID